MRIDIQPISSKGREVLKSNYEYLELGNNYLLYAMSQKTKEYDVNEDDKDIDELISTINSEKTRKRSSISKIRKDGIDGVHRFWSYANERWAVQPICIDDDFMLILFETEEEAEIVYNEIDKWLFE